MSLPGLNENIEEQIFRHYKNINVWSTPAALMFMCAATDSSADGRWRAELCSVSCSDSLLLLPSTTGPMIPFSCILIAQELFYISLYLTFGFTLLVSNKNVITEWKLYTFFQWGCPTWQFSSPTPVFCSLYNSNGLAETCTIQVNPYLV